MKVAEKEGSLWRYVSEFILWSPAIMAEALKVLIVIERLERSLETFEIFRCQSVFYSQDKNWGDGSS